MNTPNLFAVDEDSANWDQINKICGCFVIISQDPETKQGAFIAEDGFWINLDHESWITFCDAICHEETCFVEGQDGYFTFHWAGWDSFPI